MDVTAAAGKPLTAEEEALRRSTDCIYFLASPLTCKKGVECEFRHSDGARLNPRDCWYWLNGNCLNSKCSFRHPPLDGLYGNSGTSGPAAPAVQSAAASTQGPAPTTATYNVNKQNVPCYYFQKGLCLKGDWCPFTHGPKPTAISPMQQVAKASSTSTIDPSQSLQTLRGSPLKEWTAQQNASNINVDMPAEGLRLSTNRVARAETAVNNGQAGLKHLPYQPPKGAHPRPQQTKVPLGSGVDLQRPPNHQSQPGTEQLQIYRKADDQLLGALSGSDALADEANQGRPLHQSRRNLVHTDDLDYRHQDFERDQSHKLSDCDRYEQVPNQFGRAKRSSTEMFVGQRSYVPEGKLPLGSRSSDEVDGSDLRLRLMKQRKLNGSSSGLHPDRRGETSRRNDCNAEERNQHRDSQRDRQDNHQEGSIRNRLQGRISAPRRLSPDRPADIQPERESDWRRSQGRVSPGRPMSHRGRLSERIKWKPDEVRSADIWSSGGKPIQIEDEEQLNFAGPKSLAELKGLKDAESCLSSGEHKGRVLKKQVGHQEPEASLPFEGPKPLSTILKQKRGVASTISRDEEGDNNVNPALSSSVLSSNMQSIPLDLDDEEEEGQIRAEDEELPNDQDSCREKKKKKKRRKKTLLIWWWTVWL
ncbi:CCCH zinc finger domain-containing protein [Dioscorea alata]|uniref:CCCH zinc finger domain-containing protein n=1 Tax=Dioscorea alata TaxID=55571 RepID=A0ACB7UVS2_DIOAL|nr:CCCH zinc finger domain-containing protein [Dioscorea alata]